LAIFVEEAVPWLLDKWFEKYRIIAESVLIIGKKFAKR